MQLAIAHATAASKNNFFIVNSIVSLVFVFAVRTARLSRSNCFLVLSFFFIRLQIYTIFNILTSQSG